MRCVFKKVVWGLETEQLFIPVTLEKHLKFHLNLGTIAVSPERVPGEKACFDPT